MTAQKNASKEQELQAAQNKTKTDADSQVQDKRLNGPNRPST